MRPRAHSLLTYQEPYTEGKETGIYQLPIWIENLQAQQSENKRVYRTEVVGSGVKGREWLTLLQVVEKQERVDVDCYGVLVEVVGCHYMHV